MPPSSSGLTSLFTAHAAPAPSSNAATRVVNAFRTLHSTPDTGLAKRQLAMDVVKNLQDLLQKAIASQKSSQSQCHDECSAWVGLLEVRHARLSSVSETSSAETSLHRNVTRTRRSTRLGCARAEAIQSRR